MGLTLLALLLFGAAADTLSPALELGDASTALQTHRELRGETYPPEDCLEESDAVQTIYMSASDGDPRYISLGEHDSELLITTDLGKVLRRCLDGTGCNPQTRNSVMMQYGGSNLYGIGVLDATYIIADRGNEKIYECPLTSVGISKINCEVFADKPQGTEWDPRNVLVDPIKRLVFVVDNFFSDVLVLDFDGAFLAPLASSRGALMQPTAMAQRPGLYAPLSPSHPPSSLPTAGERIEVALAMMDAYNSTVSNSHPTSAHDLALEVSAYGYITGTNFTTTIVGEIMYNKNSTAHASLTASVVIPYAGDWIVSVTQGTYNVHHFLGSPRLITVAAAATDPASCAVELTVGRSVTAGSSFEAIVKPFDEFENPTSHPEDSFKSRVELGNGEENFGNRHELPADHTFSEIRTVVGAYKLYLYHANTQREVAGSPISFDVLPDAPSSAASTASAGNTTSIVSVVDTALPLQAFVNDAFGNEVLDAPGVVVKVQGLDSLDPAAVVERGLEGPRYSHTVTILEGLEAKLIISFHLNDVQIGETAEIAVAPPLPAKVIYDKTKLYIGGGVGCFVLIAGTLYFLYYRHTSKRKVKKMLSAHLQTQARREDEAEELRKKAAIIVKEKEEEMARANNLRKKNENLEDSLRKKKHSEKEMDAMRRAMDGQKEERKDELRTVLISSSEIEIKELLGQGGMGKVHLANYKGQLVAVKQLLTINDDSVMRFRRECFLTKEMSHPNVVRLIGVTWDDLMLGCVLEYVDGGSLQDRLKKDWNEDFEDKITWKGELLKWAREAALGCQYLHHKRYFDETADEWKEGIVHRDLKPDNMLVTTEGVLKLTDFGEARTAEVDMTMTAVGTPIFVCPEIIRSGRYDAKADSYSFGICLVAMMRVEDTIVNFFFNALIKKMRKATRMGVGLMALNRNIEKGWRPTLPEEFYPSLVDLIWRCWDDDPEKRPNMDEVVRLLMGPIADEVRSNHEPIFGSGKVIGACSQKDMGLADDDEEGVTRTEHERVVSDLGHERDLIVAEHKKVLAELQGRVEKAEGEVRVKEATIVNKNKELQDSMLSAPWRVYAFLAAVVGLVGHFGSLTGFFAPEDDPAHWRWWHETYPDVFVYQQLTFITSSLYIYTMMTTALTGRSGGDTTKFLLAYPIVTIAYFTVFTGGVFWGLWTSEYLNHLVNQCIFLVYALGCKDVRKYILRHGWMGPKGVNIIVAKFVVCYYGWIWACWMTLGTWPYPFMNLFETGANVIFGGIAAGCFALTAALYLAVGLIEDRFGAGWKMKGMPATRRSPRAGGKGVPREIRKLQ
ncbi:hypothetical protein TeGR_g9797 [Tetraparma gracilis]|uniref:Protein kinase domain-containing protein n=1 Tax=Tetraparma gracilis TaxID=2962635 RepID=A0ABQ6MB66_9STRA|nr:hypothetical protein TeGR_g9797 [Tetraparma gracilis]